MQAWTENYKNLIRGVHELMKMIISIYIQNPSHHSLVTSCECQLTDAEDDLVDVNGGEVQEEEREVDDEKKEAQDHTQPLLEPFT